MNFLTGANDMELEYLVGPLWSFFFLDIAQFFVHMHAKRVRLKRPLAQCVQ